MSRVMPSVALCIVLVLLAGCTGGDDSGRDPPDNQVRGGDIYGSVALADGSKVPGVLITLTGDTIGRLTTISSEQGNFRFLQLPPGSYLLKFELEGFKTVIRKDIELSLGRSVTLNILMETTTLKEEVVV